MPREGHRQDNSQHRIAIVCDAYGKLGAIPGVLSLDHSVLKLSDGVSALDEILLNMSDIVLVDIDIAGMSAREFLERLHRSTSRQRPIIVLFGPRADVRIRAIETHGLVDTVIGMPCSSGAFLCQLWKVSDARLEASWTSLNPMQRRILKLGMKSVQMMTNFARGGEPIDTAVIHEVCDSLVSAARADELVGALDALKAHHNQSFVHTLRVAISITIFGRNIGICDHELVVMTQAGLLHDVGKTGIPPDVLYKAGPLDDEEWMLMRRHPELSLELLNQSSDLNQETIEVAYNHHERLDGTGYPRGLKGGEIDDLSLCCAIADVFSSLTEKRSYKARMTNEESLDVMRDMAGNHLEPSYFKRFEQMVRAGVVR